LLYSPNVIILLNKFEWNNYPYNRYIAKEGKKYIQENLMQLPENRWRVHTNKNEVKKVLVVGGMWEPTHNQLCFFNYFETELGKKEYTWRTMHDFLVTEDD